MSPAWEAVYGLASQGLMIDAAVFGAYLFLFFGMIVMFSII